jgi:LAO/AO transport system kinase
MDGKQLGDRPGEGDVLGRLLDGDHRALARAITWIENRSPGYRELVAGLHEHTGDAAVIGITGSPGAGKSTLVDKLAAAYRADGLTVGVIAVDPSSPFTGGAVLGDRIRIGSNVGDMDVFVRSMSARGSLGGVSLATADAVKALDAFGKDRILVETVGAGQNEIDVVKTADTVAVLLQPGSGDDVQMLKAGILEIADVFCVNKADRDGVDRVVNELREMLDLRDDDAAAAAGHHGTAGVAADGTRGTDDADSTGSVDHDDTDDGDRTATSSDGGPTTWEPPIVETVATRGEGVGAFRDALDDHRTYLDRSGRLEAIGRTRAAEEIRALLREDANRLVAEEIESRGGIEALAGAVAARETDPYTVADSVLEPLAECVREQRQR